MRRPARSRRSARSSRLAYQNFYYDQEDEVFAAAERQGFSWSVHRPHTLIGYAVGNQMNMAATLGAYAAICKETGRPFVFPGSPQQYEAAVDVTDGRIIAKHLLWAATEPAARNQALNIVNGEVFRWNWLWPKLAAHLGVEAAPYPGHAQPLESQMAGMEPSGTGSSLRTGFRRTRSEPWPPGGTAMPISAASSRTSPT